MKAYQYTADSYFAGEIDDYGLLPNNATYTAPHMQEGHIPRWNGTIWEQVEDHKGEQGYAGGQPFTVKEYGPYPDGWSITPPEPTAAEAALARAIEIQTLLDEIDRKSARPLRAVAAGTATDDDRTALADLEQRAVGLRGELSALGGCAMG